MLHHETIPVGGMDCADCARSIERGVAGLPGVSLARVNFATGQLVVEYEAERTDRSHIVGRVRELGYEAGAEPAAAEALATPNFVAGVRAFLRRNPRLIATALCGLFLAAAFLLDLIGAGQPFVAAAALGTIVVGGYHVARAGWQALRLSRTLDMNALMSLAVLGAAAIGDWLEAGTVVFLFALGNALEAFTVDRARGAIRQLMALAPREARVRREGAEITLPVEAVRVDDVVRVRPGERVPVDGVVLAGASSLDQAPITGESVPVDKAPGDQVFAGSVNGPGYLEVRATRPYQETTIARIIRLVEETQVGRAPTQRLVDRFSARYTPTVIAVAIALATVPTLLFGQPFGDWFYRALVLLVIACPCALVISTPVAIVAAITRAARDGVLIKGGAALEALGGVHVFAVDKTGTLTTGRPEVVDVIPADQALSPRQLLALAAAVEARSEHPLARAIVRHAQHEAADVPAAIVFQAFPGRGARARVVPTIAGAAGPAALAAPALPRWVSVGSPRWLEAERIDLAPVRAALADHEAAGRTVLVVAVDGRAAGLIALADRPRPGARAALETLRRRGVERVVLLTGDNRRTAATLAAELGLDEVRAELLPEDKVQAVRELLAQGKPVAMLGDGVNDAPALAAATVGIAMGAAGTAVALETADVALMADDLERAPHALGLARAAMATIRQNVAVSILTKALFLVLGATGLAGLWLAVLADTGTSLLVTLNGMRLLRWRGRR
ncbi:MAG TPA: cation-translocating P-type ATPase [Chloroflexota bacterium]|nr:cation-translocating P-type ATPase [Chloroflexota bacterium]